MSEPLEQARYSFRDVFEVLASSRSFEDVLDVILATTLRELNAEQGSLLLLEGSEETGTHLKMLAAHGMPDEILKRGYVPRKGSISEYVLRERRPLIINDTPRTDKYESMADETSTPRRIRSAVCVPLIARGRVIGTMNLNRLGGPERELFEEADLEACSILAGQAAIVIENRRLQDELLQKERLAAVGQTVSGISHCIKNILAGVKGGLGITQMGLDSNDNQLVRDGFELLKRNTGTLSNLVLDLLDYSKEREPMRDHFDVARTLQDVANTLKFKAENLGVQLVVAPGGRLSFFGDADQVLRAILNLATNAVEATGEYHQASGQGRVEIAARRIGADEVGMDSTASSEWVEIRVEDNGPGIPEELRAQIWELFFSTKGSKGTGIGLAATRKMIEEHGGTIRLHSEVGEGTVFQVLLPCSS